MKNKHLYPKRAFYFVLSVLLLIVAGMTKLQAQNITFADANVKAICVANWDTDNDGELSYAEAAVVTSLGNVFYYSSILSFDELRYFIGLTTIDNYAFYCCYGLTSIEIPNSVTSIGQGAFSNCTGLTSIEIPNSVTNMGTNPFSSCSGLEQIVVEADNMFYDLRANCNAIINSSTNELITGCKNTVIPDSVTSIGIWAFGSCTGLTSIEIPNSVTSIGSCAFIYCYGLTSMTIWADNPPTLDNNVFENVNKSIIVYVPCNAVETYQNTDGWNEFTNMIGLCSGEVAVVVNPVEGGTVTGAGYYNGGDLCELTATPNPGFSFGNWTENGIVVSTDTILSFYAYPTTIVANFCSNSPIVFADANVKNLCVANWDTDGDGELSYIEAAAVTSLDEVFRENTDIVSFNELQYFIGLTSIGDYAFCLCTSLTSVEIPNSVSEIGISAFWYCNSLTSITVWAENPPILYLYGGEEEEFKVVGNWYFDIIFSGVKKNIPVYVPCGAVEAYQNADGWNGFTNIIGMCSGEVAVTVNPQEGGTVTGAGYYSEGDICVLTATPNPGFSFGNWTKNGVVVSMDSVYSFPAHPITIVANFCSNSPIVFADANVKNLCVANWDTNDDGELSYAEAATVTSLGEVFCNNSSILSFDELQYFVGLTSIGSNAFYNCSGLTSIQIPNFVTSIGSSAFYNCADLISIEIPNSVTSIGNNAFRNCTSLTSIEIPNSVTSIDDFAFSGCSGLTSIEIHNSVTDLGTNPFADCSGLEQIIVEEGNMFYDSRDNCNAIINSNTNELITGCKNTIIPNSVTSIGYGAFSGCSDLTSMEIPNSVTSMGGCAFYNCSSLTTIVLSSSLVYINWYAFYNCINLESMTVLAETPPSLYDNTFSNCPKSIPVYVPCGSAEAYQSAAYWNEFTNFIEMCEVSQIIPLSAGWNWFSTNVDITLEDLQNALVDALPNTSITIKSKDNGTTSYNGSIWRGQLNTLDVTQMYRISVSTACEITIEGMPINPAEHPITISNGANWIGFPLSESMSLSNAFAGFAVSGDQVKGKNAASTYNGTNWRGNLNTLVPGQGYIYKSAATGTRTFTFPASTK